MNLKLRFTSLPFIIVAHCFSSATVTMQDAVGSQEPKSVWSAEAR